MTDYRALCADAEPVSLKHTGGWRAAAHPDLSAIELVWSCPPVRLRVGADTRRYPNCGAAWGWGRSRTGVRHVNERHCVWYTSQA